MQSEQLAAAAIESAEGLLVKNDFASAWEWLETIEPALIPPDLAAHCCDGLSRYYASLDDWAEASRFSILANKYQSTSRRQNRIALIRNRTPWMGDREWETMNSSIEPAVRFGPESLQPELRLVCAAGAYISRGTDSNGPWSRYLRISKSPPDGAGERAAIFGLAGGYLTRFVFERSEILKSAQIVVPVPADPTRFVSRMSSLPDELCQSLSRSFAIPHLFRAIARRDDNSPVEMKKLSRSQRQEAASVSFLAGAQLSEVEGLSVLLVDDIVTSGSTMRACARILREGGASEVLGCCLAHTEG